MSTPADRTATLGAAKVHGISNHAIFQSNPALAQLEGQFAAMQALVIELQTVLNALVAAYNTAETATLSTSVKPVPAL
jgi:hypothetical protein